MVRSTRPGKIPTSKRRHDACNENQPPNAETADTPALPRKAQAPSDRCRNDNINKISPTNPLTNIINRPTTRANALPRHTIEVRAIIHQPPRTQTKQQRSTTTSPPSPQGPIMPLAELAEIQNQPTTSNPATTTKATTRNDLDDITVMPTQSPSASSRNAAENGNRGDNPEHMSMIDWFRAQSSTQPETNDHFLTIDGPTLDDEDASSQDVEIDGSRLLLFHPVADSIRCPIED